MSEGLGDGSEQHDSVAGHVQSRLKILGLQAATILMDGVFLAIWVVVNWALDHFAIEPMRLSGFDNRLLISFRVTFGGATLVTVLISVLEDIITMSVQAWRRIQNVRKGG